MQRTRIDQIQKRIERIKAELVAIDDMRPGSLTEQFKDPDAQRGAYYQLNYWQGGRTRTDYVSRDFVRDVRRQLANYKRFKALTAEWTDLSIEQSRLKMKSASKTRKRCGILCAWARAWARARARAGASSTDCHPLRKLSTTLRLSTMSSSMRTRPR